MNKYIKRLGREKKNNEQNQNFEFEEIKDRWIFTWTEVEGLYAGQEHRVSMKLTYGSPPREYSFPTNPPFCKFETKIWHPNISENGIICVDILSDPNKWSAVTRTSSIIDSIRYLLSNPEPSSPQNRKAARMYMGNKEEYKRKIKTFYLGKKS